MRLTDRHLNTVRVPAASIPSWKMREILRSAESKERIINRLEAFCERFGTVLAFDWRSLLGWGDSARVMDDPRVTCDPDLLARLSVLNGRKEGLLGNGTTQSMGGFAISRLGRPGQTRTFSGNRKWQRVAISHIPNQKAGAGFQGQAPHGKRRGSDNG